MEDNANSIETLLEKTVDYAKTSVDVAKLQALDKASDLLSSLIPHTVVFVVFASFMIFLNLGIAFWLGEILGRTFFGFFVVAGFYILTGLSIHFFMHNWLKNKICNFIIRQFLK